MTHILAIKPWEPPHLADCTLLCVHDSVCVCVFKWLTFTVSKACKRGRSYLQKNFNSEAEILPQTLFQFHLTDEWTSLWLSLAWQFSTGNWRCTYTTSFYSEYSKCFHTVFSVLSVKCWTAEHRWNTTVCPSAVTVLNHKELKQLSQKKISNEHVLQWPLTFVCNVAVTTLSV